MVRVVEEPNEEIRRLKVAIQGAVQGVGFRPFVYRLAAELQLRGWVSNTPQGVIAEAEGPLADLHAFIARIHSDKPSIASIHSCETTILDPKGYAGFEIRESTGGGSTSALVMPDIATCPDCLREIFDPEDRRYLYPFTNCTNCGPRFTIVRSLPYDRKHTTMKPFAMCDACAKEYDDPADRRFHAQPNACPDCGPQAALWDRTGAVIGTRTAAIADAAEAIRTGGIVAVKGLGGFLLMCDARNASVVRTLRERKHRSEKPFALMFPSIEDIEKECEVSQRERQLLLSPQAPIVLLKIRRIGASNIAPHAAPGNPYLGVMLPSTPLHHLLMSLIAYPVIATSGNISDEPICIDERAALAKLHAIADMYLVHDREIERYCDDSIVRVVQDRELVVRRARGYAPLPVHLPQSMAHPVLAVGAQLKNTIAIASGDAIFVSQHIGDLETAESLQAFNKSIDDFQTLYECVPSTIVHDLHPEYLSTAAARNGLSQRYAGARIAPLQHHFAHIASCMAENELTGPVTGFAWDGTGYGTDGTLWGGECIRYEAGTFTRVGTIRAFKLPGGEAAIREPRRCALSMLHELRNAGLVHHAPDADGGFTERERSIVTAMLDKNINAPATTSIGRVFDAVAAFCGVRMKNTFEGQAAMELEHLAAGSTIDEAYPVVMSEERGLLVWEWAPTIEAIVEDAARGRRTQEIAMMFHTTLALVILRMAEARGEKKVVLSGGCFQNMILLEKSIALLRSNGFAPYWHQRIPANDGGIALGQIYSVFLLQHAEQEQRARHAQQKEQSGA